MKPRIVVFSTLFPNPAQPNAGVFIRERMFRVGKQVPIAVVAPSPWFPLQGLLRRFRPHFRPDAPVFEEMMGVQVFRPRFFCIPGVFKFLDGFFMALGSFDLMRQLKNTFKFNLIDAHFGYPDGHAATLLGKWLNVPVTITLRGTEVPHSKEKFRRIFLVKALREATRLFSVSSSLKKYAVSLGIDEDKIRVVGNGVDLEKFKPVEKKQAREELGIQHTTKVIITVGALVERKGVQRVLEILPTLINRHPDILYLIVGGASAEGDWTDRLKQQVEELNLKNHVRFLGPRPPDELKNILSTSDVFILSTSNEGWANVLLEAMACGLPIVTTDVGGNKEVVCRPELGIIVPFGDAEKLFNAVDQALTQIWDQQYILDYARANSWDTRVDILVDEFEKIVNNE
jgi:glycosyltransferase involved in cell wall biosynthesis